MSEIPEGAGAGFNLAQSQFVAAFPFFVAWDERSVITGYGPSLRKLCPDVCIGVLFTQLFNLERPVGGIFQELLRVHKDSLFLFRHIAGGQLFRAQLILSEANGISGMFLSSPWFTEPEEVAKNGLTLSDFAVHDPVFDLLQVVQSQRGAVGELKSLASSLTKERTKLREANQQLVSQQKESRTLALVAARTDNAVVLTCNDGLIEWVNEAFTRITGYTFEEVKGRSPGSLLQGPKTSPKAIQRIREALRIGESISTEILNYRKDGTSYWLSIEIQPMFDDAGRLTNFMAIERDITQSRLAEKRRAIQYNASQILASSGSVRQAGARILQSVSERLGGAVGLFWMRNPGSKVMRCLESWHHRDIDATEFLDASFGIEVIKGKFLPGLVWESGNSMWIEDLGMYLECPRSSSAVDIGLRGTIAFPIMSNGEIRGVFEFFGDKLDEPDEDLGQVFSGIGSQMGQFVGRNQAESDLREAKEIAERANEAKSLFLATMSHEIRTPLNGIIGFSDLMSESELTQTQKEHLETIRKSGDILLHIINDVLDFSRIESGGIQIEQIEFNPVELIEETMAIHAHGALSKKLSLSLDVGESVPKKVLGDSARLRQVLMNLVGNAIKFTEAGGVLIGLSADAGKLNFEVRDTGVGFEQSQVRNLFKPFQQADASTTRRFGGTGLGLAISYRLLDLMGGEISAKSAPGKGSVFSFHIPLSESFGASSAKVPQESGKLHQSNNESDASGHTILVAEDNIVNAKLLKILLEKLGYLVLIAENGREAIDTLIRHPECVAILMDVRMPIMDGTEAVRRLRSGEAGELGKTIPIVAITASVLPADQQACIDAGMDHFFMKPFRPEDLTSALRKVGVLI